MLMMYHFSFTLQCMYVCIFNPRKMDWFISKTGFRCDKKCSLVCWEGHFEHQTGFNFFFLHCHSRPSLCDSM